MSDHTPDEQITTKDIAALAGVRASAVSNWRNPARGLRFPAPSATAQGRPLFRRSEVIAWLTDQNKVNLGVTIDDAADAAVAFQRRLSEIVPIRDQPRVLAAALIDLAVAREADNASSSGVLIPTGLRSSLPAGDHEVALMTEGATGALFDWLRLRRPAIYDLARPVDGYEKEWPRILALSSTIGVSLDDLASTLDFVTERARTVIRGAGDRAPGSRHIAELIARLTPAGAERIVDLTVGDGDALLAAASAAPGAQLHAVDLDPDALRLARQRLLLHGRAVKGSEGDAVSVGLRDADLVIAEPGERRSLDLSWQAPRPGERPADAQLAIALRAARLLSSNGVGLVFLPATALDRPSAVPTRTELIETGRLAAVVDLGRSSGRQILALVLRGAASDSVLFSSDSGISADMLLDEDAALPSAAARIAASDLLGARAVLTPARWIGTPDERRPADDVADDLRDRLRVARQSVRDLTPASVGIVQQSDGASIQIQQLVADGALSTTTRPEQVRDEGVISLRMLRDARGLRFDPASPADQDAGEPDRDPWTRAVEPGDVLVWVNGDGVRASVYAGADRRRVTSRAEVVRVLQPERVRPEFLALSLGAPRSRRFVSSGAIGRLALADVDIAVPALDAQDRLVEAALQLEAGVARIEAALLDSQVALAALRDAAALGRVTLIDPS